jgi:hypothetical protein
MTCAAARRSVRPRQHGAKDSARSGGLITDPPNSTRLVAKMRQGGREGRSIMSSIENRSRARHWSSAFRCACCAPRPQADRYAGGRAGAGTEAHARETLIKVLVCAHRWQRIESGRAKSITELAEQEGACRLLPLAWLVPRGPRRDDSLKG